MRHKPKADEPAKQVHWSTGEVVLSLPDGKPARVAPAKAEDAQQQPPAADRQASEPVPAGGRLARTLSELLGVEISIQADRKALEEGLVLLEHGKDGSRWQVVLSEPKEPVAETAISDTKPEDEKEPSTAKDEPEKRPFELRPGSGPVAAVPAWVLVVAAILILTVAWRSSRRRALEITEDSRDFQDALRIWLPWLMAKQGTPRAVKRFVNRLRYIATRLRKAAGSEDGGFPEPNTVALAAIHFFDSEWLTNGYQYRMVSGSKIDSLLKPGGGIAARMDEEQVGKLAGSLAGVVDEYAAWIEEEGLSEEERQRRGNWIPSEEHRNAFLAVISEKSVVG